MQEKIEKRGKYTIKYYSIKVDENMKNDALKFAKEIILSGNQYSRLLPNEIVELEDIRYKEKLEIQRTYMGKLGELVFNKLLYNKGKNVDTSDMLKIFEGENKVDKFDFKTKNGKLVDVKTGYRKNHIRLVINLEQFKKKKDYYVSVKINTKPFNDDKYFIDWDSIEYADVIGYADYDYLCKYAKESDLGEGVAKHVCNNKLMGIDKLLNKF